jgi:hypothetical protein
MDTYEKQKALKVIIKTERSSDTTEIKLDGNYTISRRFIRRRLTDQELVDYTKEMIDTLYDEKK